MKVYYNLEELVELKNPVVAIGSFDGVHLGHRRILQYLQEYAREIQGQSVVVTFDPHPQEVLRPASEFFRINTLAENIRLIENQGVDALVVIPFTKEFSKLSYAEFLDLYVVGKIHASALVMGPNHALGCNREGGRQQIEELCAEHNVQVVEIPELMLQDAAVHSATIRKLIQQKDWVQVEKMLGYPYVYEKKSWVPKF